MFPSKENFALKATEIMFVDFIKDYQPRAILEKVLKIEKDKLVKKWEKFRHLQCLSFKSTKIQVKDLVTKGANGKLIKRKKRL